MQLTLPSNTRIIIEADGELPVIVSSKTKSSRVGSMVVVGFFCFAAGAFINGMALGWKSPSTVVASKAASDITPLASKPLKTLINPSQETTSATPSPPTLQPNPFGLKP